MTNILHRFLTEIDEQIEQLKAARIALVNVSDNPMIQRVTPDVLPTKRKMTASARKRIAAAQKKRWAAWHKERRRA